METWGADDEEDTGTLDTAAIAAIRAGTSKVPDLEAAERLMDRVAGTMIAVATGGPRIDEVKGQYRREYGALAAVLKRLRIRNPNSLDDLWTWYGKWTADIAGGYAERRAYVAELYAPVRAALAAATDDGRDIAAGMEDGPTGWVRVDERMGTLRRRVRQAEDTADDAKAVGLQCVSVLEALGRAAFDAERHLPDGEDPPHPNDAKSRLGHFLTSVTDGELGKGERFEHVRILVRATWRQAQSVKHRDEPNVIDAGIAADATALLVAIVRRLADEDQPPAKTRQEDDDIPF